MSPEIREQSPRDLTSTLIEILGNSKTKPSKANLEIIGNPEEGKNRNVVIFLEFNNRDLRDEIVSSIPVNAGFETKKSDPSNLIIKGEFSKEEIEKIKSKF